MKIVYTVLVASLATCAATTGVVPIEEDLYVIAREDNDPAASLDAPKAATFEAGAFCVGQAKTMQVKKVSDTLRSLGQFPQSTLQFQYT